jgi:TldD protein
VSLLTDVVAQLRRRGAAYADIRWITDARETLAVRDGRVERHFAASSSGFGVRVLVDGAWGFGARAGEADDAAALEAAAEAALLTARAAASVALPGAPRVELAEEEPQRGRFAVPVARDFFAVPLADKLALLHAATDALRAGAGTRARSASAHLGARRQRKLTATSDGTSVEQTLVHAGGGMKLSVADGDEVAHRTYPLELDGGVAAGGWEVVEALDLVGNAPRIADEALALLTAPPCPAGETTLILDTPQLALQIHESCGHPTESDRAFGDEVSLAGASFLTPDRLGRFRYGSVHVNLTADATTPGALGSFGWDDEGVPARKTPLVARGWFVGYLTSRETAARLGLSRSGGCLRAEAWNRFPIIRMINVSLEPDPRGPASLDELVADTDDGVLMANNKSWSIDDLRLNFQFGCELAWEVKRGKRTRILKNPLYGGTTPRFWSACDAIGGPDAFRMHGLLSCGKGDPMQLMAVGHGCAPARFRGIKVGAG